MTFNGSTLLSVKKPILSGIIAVFKDKGNTIKDYKNWIRLTLSHENAIECDWDNRRFIDIKLFPKWLEDFSQGVVVVGFGHWSKSIVLSRFWTQEWVVTGRLGIETQTFSYNSSVVKELPFSHINEEMMRNSFQSFIGLKQLLIPPFIEQKNDKKETIELNKRRDENSYRIRECHAIELLDFNPPDFTLKIVSEGNYYCSSLIHSLGIKLDSCAHLTQCRLKKIGPIDENDCLKKHEIHLNNIRDYIEKYPDLGKDIKEFEKLVPKKFNKLDN